VKICRRTTIFLCQTQHHEHEQTTENVQRRNDTCLQSSARTTTLGENPRQADFYGNLSAAIVFGVDGKVIAYHQHNELHTLSK